MEYHEQDMAAAASAEASVSAGQRRTGGLSALSATTFRGT